MTCGSASGAEGGKIATLHVVRFKTDDEVHRWLDRMQFVTGARVLRELQTLTSPDEG
jgi:hypothetical protein